MDYWTKQKNCDLMLSGVVEKLRTNTIDEDFKNALRGAIAACG